MAHALLLRALREREQDLLDFMKSRLHSPDVAHDLHQELFLKISAFEEGSEIRNASSYLFQMASNLVIDHQRRERRQQNLQTEIRSYLDAPANTLTPERHALAREELTTLMQVVEQMSPRTRQIFRMNRFEGMSQRAIAEQLGISQTAVEKHIRKALEQLVAART